MDTLSFNNTLKNKFIRLPFSSNGKRKSAALDTKQHTQLATQYPNEALYVMIKTEHQFLTMSRLLLKIFPHVFIE